MTNISEKDIMKKWRVQLENPLVSIKCTTYNHEKYIADCLEGFLKQETDFPFEIVVHDDASTDSTASIIREYEERYPHMIVAIYEKENQYSKQDGSIKRIMDSTMKGKYVAICEGDDYWVDEYKLQSQIEYMESHPECTFCFTNGKRLTGEVFGSEVVQGNIFAVRKENKQVFNPGEIELLDFLPTASFVYRKATPLIPISKDAYSGDRYLALSYTAAGYAYFIDKPMVVYRDAVEGSATYRWRQDPVLYASIADRFVALYREINVATNYEYSSIFEMRICQWKLYKANFIGDSKALRELISSGEIKKLKIMGNMYFAKNYFKCACNKTYQLLIAIKKRISSGQ